ncbi:MAG: LysR family transcriptional regulator [Alphaproteobacteria bacterium]|nr:LysR family transcriptional regulator [Alphaproteobacteria bacterium]
MELRHLRYFIAVAEEGSVTVAAEKRLHTAQPSLSRQLRDLEIEVGAPLFTRGARGVQLTAAGRAFLVHARVSVSEAGEAVQAARRAGRPAKAVFSVGFLMGQEVDWLPHVTRILRAELPKIEFKVTSMFSPDVAEALQKGEIDLGFMRVERQPDVTFVMIAKEPIVVVLPSDHPLAEEREIDPIALEGETLVGFSDFAIVLREVVEGYLIGKGIELTPSHRVENPATILSLVASLRGVALMPAYIEALLPWSVVSRPLKGEPPTIDLAVGYRSDNPSPVLKTFLAGLDQLITEGPAGTRQAR